MRADAGYPKRCSWLALAYVALPMGCGSGGTSTNVSSGTLNLLSFFKYIIGKGWIPSTSTVGAIDYGVELVSTDNADAVFAVTAFSLTDN